MKPFPSRSHPCPDDLLNRACCAHCRTAKFIGDRRADVAIRSFGRPYNKIMIAESGPLT